MPEKEYKYRSKYITADGEVKDYNHIIVKDLKKSELRRYIKKVIKFTTEYKEEISALEELLKTLIHYKGYNNKNLQNRLYRLENAGEINLKDKKMITVMMSRQQNIADEMTKSIEFILELYKENDEEIKEINKQLEEFNKI